MRLRTAPLTLLVAIVAGCSGPWEEPVPTTTTTTSPPTAQELIALEGTPGVTPALADATEPAPAPVEGLEGTPGPSPAVGPADALVYVWVFTDFQCPVCRRAVEPLKHLARAFPDEVRIVLKQNALPSHSRATAAAAASMAAFRQGKFWEYHDRLFTTGQLDEQGLVEHAKALGLDLERFERDRTDEAVLAQIRYESALAAKLGLGGTPGFLLNGKPQLGWGSYMGTANDVREQLERAKKVAATGVPADRVAYEATQQIGPTGETIAAALFPPPAK